MTTGQANDTEVSHGARGLVRTGSTDGELIIAWGKTLISNEPTFLEAGSWLMVVNDC